MSRIIEEFVASWMPPVPRQPMVLTPDELSKAIELERDLVYVSPKTGRVIVASSEPQTYLLCETGYEAIGVCSQMETSTGFSRYQQAAETIMEKMHHDAIVIAETIDQLKPYTGYEPKYHFSDNGQRQNEAFIEFINRLSEQLTAQVDINPMNQAVQQYLSTINYPGLDQKPNIVTNLENLARIHPLDARRKIAKQIRIRITQAINQLEIGLLTPEEIIRLNNEITQINQSKQAA